MANKTLLEKIKNYEPKMLAETPISAAVMIIFLTTETNEMEIVLTKRTATLATYAGDYSFPGGMRDPDDSGLYATAMREVQEELNIPATLYQHIGQLDDFMNHYGHLVRPFVAIMKKSDFLDHHQIAIEEVQHVYYFSLLKLDDIQDNPSLHTITRRRPSYSFQEGDVFVWGLTATILVHLLNILASTNKSLGKMIH